MSVNIRDFYVLNHWKVDIDGPKYRTGEPALLIDQSTGRKYLNESAGVVRFKCVLLTVGTPLVHLAASVFNVAYRALRVLSLYHFWSHKAGETSYNFQSRAKDVGTDLAHIVLQPLAFIGLELASLYGIVRPYDGRKLYATIERAAYGHFVLAPCFQPDPVMHFFGGDLNEKNAF